MPNLTCRSQTSSQTQQKLDAKCPVLSWKEWWCCQHWPQKSRPTQPNDIASTHCQHYVPSYNGRWMDNYQSKCRAVFDIHLATDYTTKTAIVLMALDASLRDQPPHAPLTQCALCTLDPQKQPRTSHLSLWRSLTRTPESCASSSTEPTHTTWRQTKQQGRLWMKKKEDNEWADGTHIQKLKLKANRWRQRERRKQRDMAGLTRREKAPYMLRKKLCFPLLQQLNTWTGHLGIEECSYEEYT